MTANEKKYDITGMSCAACSSRVEKAVSKVSGVESCSVNLLTNSMKNIKKTKNSIQIEVSKINPLILLPLETSLRKLV